MEGCGKGITVFYVGEMRYVAVDMAAKIRMLGELQLQAQPPRGTPQYQGFAHQEANGENSTACRQVAGQLQPIVAWRPGAVYASKRCVAGAGPKSQRYQAARAHEVVRFLKEAPERGRAFCGEGWGAQGGKILGAPDASFKQAVAETEPPRNVGGGKLGTRPLGPRMGFSSPGNVHAGKDRGRGAALPDYQAWRITKRRMSSYAAEAQPAPTSDVKASFAQRLSEWVTASARRRDKVADGHGLRLL